MLPALSQDPEYLNQKLEQVTASSQLQLSQVREELSRERARYRELETKLEEFQQQAERTAQGRLKDLQQENGLLKSDLQQERERVSDLEKILQEFGQFAGEKVQLTRRTEILQEELENALQAERETKERALADQAKLSADALTEQKLAVAEALALKEREMNANVGQETRLLREQNVQLQRAIVVLKRVKGVDFAAEAARADAERFDKADRALLEKRLGERGAEVGALNARIAALQQELTTEKAQAAQLLERLAARFEQEKGAYLQEIKSLEKLIYVKCKELYELRSTCALILQKRTDLEAFLTKCLRALLPVDDASRHLLTQAYPRTMREMHRKLLQGIRVTPSVEIDQMTAEAVVDKVIEWTRALEGHDV